MEDDVKRALADLTKRVQDGEDRFRTWVANNANVRPIQTIPNVNAQAISEQRDGGVKINSGHQVEDVAGVHQVSDGPGGGIQDAPLKSLQVPNKTSGHDELVQPASGTQPSSGSVLSGLGAPMTSKDVEPPKPAVVTPDLSGLNKA